MKTDSETPPHIRNQQGMAILMVMTSVALLSYILADFTYETKLNKIKTYNLQDKAQARLNAEAGIKFALAKLMIYQKARNEIEKQKQLKEVVKLGELEAVVTMPFIYPLPIPPSANIIQKTAIEEFMGKVVLKGQLSLQMSPVRGFYNPNNLRVPKDQKADNGQGSTNEKNQTPQAFLQTELTNMLKAAIETKSEEDEEFQLLYGQTDATQLIKELRYFVSDPGAYDDPAVPEFEAIYSEKNLKAKQAPLTSMDELYLLAGWNDAIIELIKEKLSVHESAFIPLNEITQDQLKSLFPNMTPEQSEEFFKYRDGDKELQMEAHPFDSLENFKRVVVGQLNIVDDAGYEERIKQFEKAGIKLGLAGKLFKVISIGKQGNSQYSLTAFVDMPIRPAPPVKEPDSNKNKQNDPNDPNLKQPQKKDPPPMYLLTPRVVEIRHE